MPYITEKDRERLAVSHAPQTVGELNYLATVAAIRFLEQVKFATGKVGYAEISAAISALTEAGAELRRRLLIHYEHEKIEENGDVYPAWLLKAAGAPAMDEPQPFNIVEAYWKNYREFWGPNFHTREMERHRDERIASQGGLSAYLMGEAEKTHNPYWDGLKEAEYRRSEAEKNHPPFNPVAEFEGRMEDALRRKVHKEIKDALFPDKPSSMGTRVNFDFTQDQ